MIKTKTRIKTKTPGIVITVTKKGHIIDYCFKKKKANKEKKEKLN